jgi:hypothetical protein
MPLFFLVGLALAQDPAPEAPAEETPAEEAPEAPPPSVPGQDVPPSLGPSGDWAEDPQTRGPKRLPLLGSPMACGVAAGCGGCCVGSVLAPYSVPVGLGVMATAPAAYAFYSPSGERYPDPSQMTFTQAEERRQAMRSSGVGVVIGAGVGGAAATGLLLLTILALGGIGWYGATP